MALVPEIAISELAGVLSCLCLAKLSTSLDHCCRRFNNDYVLLREFVGDQQAHIAILSFVSLNVPEHESSTPRRALGSMTSILQRFDDQDACAKRKNGHSIGQEEVG